MKYKIYYLYIFFAGVVFFIAYDFFPKSKIDFTNKVILELDTKKFQAYTKIFDINKSFGYIWGIKDEVKKISQDINKTKTTAYKELKVEQKNNQLCIEKECFRLLGFFVKKEKLYISFYNKNIKHKIASYTLGECLYKTICIKEIKNTNVVIEDDNTSRSWKFKLFDVNITKYKPKDINESDF